MSNWVKWLWSVDSERDIPKIQSAAPLNISALKWYFGVKTVQMFHFNHDKLFLQDNDISYSCTILIFKFDICILEGIFTSWLEKFYQNVNWADGERVKKIYTVQNIGFCQISIRVKSILPHSSHKNCFFFFYIRKIYRGKVRGIDET